MTSIAWLAGSALAPTEKDHPAIAVIHKEYLEPGKARGLSDEQWWGELSPVRLILECGATNFTTEWNGATHTTPVTFVDLKKENLEAANCILKNGPEEGFNIEMSELARCLPIGAEERADWRPSVRC
ncbi:MAG: hypothetical protein ACM308_03600 [Qipengyuania vulgaris]